MSLHILLAMYSEATACIRQLMCTAVNQLSSDRSSKIFKDQVNYISGHPTPSDGAYLLCPAGLFPLYNM
jgi:hypothetical protein